MKPQFSEFTYGYTVVEELSRSYGFTAVPTFPSLIEEGRKGGGYDVKLGIKGIPFFLQFKRSDLLSRTNSKYYSIFGSSYYRFNLHALRYSQQHNLLLHLERCGNPVFYIAPKFYKNKELQNNYFSKTIVKNSILISPTSIGNLPDNNEHSICFNISESKVFLCSEPKVIENKFKFNQDNVSEYVNKFKQKDGFIKYHKENWDELYSQMEHVLKTHDPVSYKKLGGMLNSDENIIIKTAKLSRLAFGSDMVIFGS